MTGEIEVDLFFVLGSTEMFLCVRAEMTLSLVWGSIHLVHCVDGRN